MRKNLLFGLLLWGVCTAQPESRLRLDQFYAPPNSGDIQAVVELPEQVKVGPHDFQLLENVDGTLNKTVFGSSLSKFADQTKWKAALVLVLDVSRSISPDSLDQIKNATVAFVKGVTLPIAVVTFADKVEVAAQFGDSREKVEGAIGQLRPTGQNTQLYAGLEQALQLLSSQPMPELQRILVISDGGEESARGPDSLDRVLKTAQKRRIPIDAIWVPTKMQGARNTLARATDATGGTIKEATYIASAFDQLADRMDNAWVVEFKRRVANTGPITREVGLRVEHDSLGSASMPLEIAATVPDPPGSGFLAHFDDLLHFLKDVKTLIALLSGILLSLGYGQTYKVLRRKKPEVAKKLPRPFWISIEVTPPATTTQPPEVVQRSPRMTRVEHAGERAPLPALALQAVKGPFEGRRIRVEREHFSIGADPENDLSVPSDDYVSGRHAVIQAVDGRWLLIDQGSRNGTIVAGQKLNGGPGRALETGDSIQLGTSEFRVVLDSARAAGASVV